MSNLLSTDNSPILGIKQINDNFKLIFGFDNTDLDYNTKKLISKSQKYHLRCEAVKYGSAGIFLLAYTISLIYFSKSDMQTTSYWQSQEGSFPWIIVSLVFSSLFCCCSLNCIRASLIIPKKVRLRLRNELHVFIRSEGIRLTKKQYFHLLDFSLDMVILDIYYFRSFLGSTILSCEIIEKNH